MITSIFKRSKPINFVILVVFLVIGFSLFWYTKSQVTLTTNFVLKQVTLLFVVVLSSFTVDFIVKKNQLSKQNNYTILLYVLLFLLLRNNFDSGVAIVSNFFVLLALRRIISLKSSIDITKKLFDASVWITVAVCFYPWAIAFYGILYLGIVFYASKNYRNWLIPIVGILTVVIITYTLQIVIGETLISIKDLNPKTLFFDKIQDNVSSLLILSIITLFATIIFFKTLNKKKLVIKRSYIVVFITFLLTVMIFIFNSVNAIYMLFPVSIIITNFYQEVKSKIIKELFTLLIILGVFLNYFLNF